MPSRHGQPLREPSAFTVDTLSAVQMSANDDGGVMETVAQISPCQQYRKAQMWLLESTRATEDTRDTIRHELLHLLVHGIGAAVTQAFNTFQPGGTDEQAAYFSGAGAAAIYCGAPVGG